MISLTNVGGQFVSVMWLIDRLCHVSSPSASICWSTVFFQGIIFTYHIYYLSPKRNFLCFPWNEENIAKDIDNTLSSAKAVTLSLIFVPPLTSYQLTFLPQLAYTTNYGFQSTIICIGCLSPQSIGIGQHWRETFPVVWKFATKFRLQ